MTSDEERPTPWEEDIKNVDALPIDADLLRGFGFEVIPKDYPEDEFNVLYGEQKICELWEYSNSSSIETPWDSYEYFHEFMDGMYDRFQELLNLEWKGV